MDNELKEIITEYNESVEIIMKEYAESNAKILKKMHRNLYILISLEFLLCFAVSYIQVITK